MFFVYVLQSKSTGKFYVGQTQDLERRLDEHNRGLARYIRGQGPWGLIYREDHTTRGEAMRRERFLKSGQGRNWLRPKLSGRTGPPEAG